MNCKSFIDLLIEKWSIMRCLLGAFTLMNLFPNNKRIVKSIVKFRNVSSLSKNVVIMKCKQIYFSFKIWEFRIKQEQFHSSTFIWTLLSVLKILEPDAAIRMQDLDKLAFCCYDRNMCWSWAEPCVCFTFLSLFYFLKYVIYTRRHMLTES